MEQKMEKDMNSLPEGCVANAISLTATNPGDACRLALVNSTFGSASQSNVVWEKFLPSGYLDTIARSSANLEVVRSFPSKKELFLYLCDNHFLIDDGRKSIWLDKQTGKKCCMLAARDLHVVWGDTQGYWDLSPLATSRFGEVAKLSPVCCLQIQWKMPTENLSPNTTYVAYLVFLRTSDLSGVGHPLADGINRQGNGSERVFLDPIAALNHRHISESFTSMRFWLSRRSQPAVTGQGNTTNVYANKSCHVQRDDSWMEVEMEEIQVQGTVSTENKELVTTLKEFKAKLLEFGSYY